VYAGCFTNRLPGATSTKLLSRQEARDFVRTVSFVGAFFNAPLTIKFDVLYHDTVVPLDYGSTNNNITNTKHEECIMGKRALKDNSLQYATGEPRD
jgi:hypothetical protein